MGSSIFLPIHQWNVVFGLLLWLKNAVLEVSKMNVVECFLEVFEVEVLQSPAVCETSWITWLWDSVQKSHSPETPGFNRCFCFVFCIITMVGDFLFGFGSFSASNRRCSLQAIGFSVQGLSKEQALVGRMALALDPERWSLNKAMAKGSSYSDRVQ